MKIKDKIAISYIRWNLRILALFSKKRAAQKALRLFCTPFPQTKRRITSLFHEAEKLHLVIDNKKIAGYRWNHPRSKKILIIHGFQSSAKKFEQHIALMINKGYEVLAFDAQAHGESDGKQVNVLEYAHLIELICKKYGPIDAFLAHSFGGLAVSLALEKSIHNSQTKLVLIAPATETSSAVDLLFSYLSLNASIRDTFEELIIAIGGKSVHWLSVSRAIENIRARILWIHDEDDDVTPIKDVHPLMLAGYPNIEFLITKGLGHRRIYHEEKVIKAIDAFL